MTKISSDMTLVFRTEAGEWRFHSDDANIEPASVKHKECSKHEEKSKVLEDHFLQDEETMFLQRRWLRGLSPDKSLTQFPVRFPGWF